ncbi:MAG: Lon protease family protein [Planctomycetota bacterium]
MEQLLPEKRPSPEDLSALLARREALMEDLRKTLRKARALGLRLVRESKSLDQDLVRELIESLTAETCEEMEAGEELTDWLADCALFAIGHLELFRRGESDPEAGADSGREEEDLEGGHRPRTRRRGLEVFEVNVVRSAGEDGCPSVYELHPNYSNLFGTVERRGLAGGPGYFHLAIRPGSLLSADGGFLVLNARDIFKEAEVWRALKRTLQTGVLQIHALESLSPLGVTGIRPEPIPIDLKVVLIGDNPLYESLHDQDFDFPTIFKVKAEFNDSHVLNRENVGKLVGVLRHTRKKEGLLPFSKSGLQALVERAVRDAGRRNRLSARLSTLFDYAREASYYARKAGKRRIDRDAVENARLEFHRQHSVDSEWFTRMVVEDVYKIDTSGTRVGSVNALTVVGYGPLGFGRPARISASVGVGEESFQHIEREVELSGPIHSKGGLILEAFIRHRFGLKRTLPIKAALVFDQSYGPIDGDSASSTEVFALLSAIGEIPLRQDLACTGAVTIEGEVLAVGGINQKIEGFFGICQARGLTGTQGVILPLGSREDLMLDEKVVQAVREGRFHLWTIDSIDQGIELLTGLPAGVRDRKGDYPPDSVMGRVEARLREFQAVLKGEEKEKEKGRDESREETPPARRRRPAAKRKAPRRKPTGH